MRAFNCRLIPLLTVCVGLAAVASAGKLTVAYNEWAGFAPVFVAQEKGFFKELGLEVDLKAFPGPGDSLPPLISGHIDVSLTTADNVVLINANTPAKVACLYMLDASDGADALVAKPEIKTLADLKGKTVATTVGEVNHLLLLKALAQGGLTEKDVRLVNMSPDDAGAAYVAGNIDAAVTWEPWVSKATEAGGVKLFTSADAPNILLDVVVAKDDVIKRKKPDLVALCKGIDQGLKFMKENPDEAHQLAGKWLNVEGPEVAAMLDGVKLYTWEENSSQMGVGGSPAKLAEGLTALAEFLMAQKKIKAKPDVQALIDTSLLE